MSDSPEILSFFVPDGDTLVPQPSARSPWGWVLHGRLIGGLAARAADEAVAADPELICSRITVDMFRSATMDPITVSSQTIRTGRRIQIIETTVSQDGEAIGQGKSVLLRRSEQPNMMLPPPPPAWSAPNPVELGEPRSAGSSGWRAPWDTWPVEREDGLVGLRGGMWMREYQSLVDGEPMTPLIRIAIAADMVSPIGNSGTEGLGFINADYTLYLAREMHGDLIGLQPYGHLSDTGIAIAQCIAHDVDGPFGFIATSALANSMARAQAENARKP